jgi:hypothetical protein
LVDNAHAGAGRSPANRFDDFHDAILDREKNARERPNAGAATLHARANPGRRWLSKPRGWLPSDL